jgi:hypothetical protein
MMRSARIMNPTIPPTIPIIRNFLRGGPPMSAPVEEFPVCAATVTWLAILMTVDSTWPAVSVVVMVMNLVGEGDDMDWLDTEGLGPSVLVVAVGIILANEGGSVVCPDVNTAHAPARTEVNEVQG